MTMPSPSFKKAAVFLLFLIFCAGFFIYLQMAPVFADPDSFYHAKISLLLSEEGLIKSFPWIRFAPFTEHFTDQHLLYHLFLIPFIKIFSPLLGVKIATVCLAVATMALFYFLLRRWKIRWPFLYLILLLSVPPFVFRMNLAKAGPLALILLFLGLFCLWEKRRWALAIISFLYVWTHGGWGLLIILAFCHLAADLIILFHISNFQTIFKFLISNFKTINGKGLITVFLGIMTGLVINPYFPRNLQFYWEQVAQIGLWNYQNVIPVGMEWYPFALGDFAAANVFPLIIALIAMILFLSKAEKMSRCPDNPLFEQEAKEKTRRIFTLCIFAGFLGVMALKSQRFIEYFTPFFILAGAFLLDFSLPADFSLWQCLKKFWRRNRFNKIVAIYLLMVWLVFFIGKGLELRQQLTKQFSWTYLSGASEWLKQNTPKGQLVFHGNWSDFPVLFYHNDHNVYIAGLDPTFFYRYDRELYKKWDKIISAREPQMAEIIKNDFGANFVLIKLTEKSLLEMAEKDPRFVLKYQDEEAKVFEIL